MTPPQCLSMPNTTTSIPPLCAQNEFRDKRHGIDLQKHVLLYIGDLLLIGYLPQKNIICRLLIRGWNLAQLVWRLLRMSNTQHPSIVPLCSQNEDGWICRNVLMSSGDKYLITYSSQVIIMCRLLINLEVWCCFTNWIRAVWDERKWEKKKWC